MKKLLVLVILQISILFSYADTGTLGTPLSLQLNPAVSMDWEFNLGTQADAIIGQHRWKDANGRVIYLPESKEGGWIRWVLRNYEVDPNPVSNSQCLGAGNPNACCTGVGTGTCDNLVDMLNTYCEGDKNPVDCCTALNEGVCRAWSETVLFNCGASGCDGQIIGVGLRTLILNQWKKKYCPGCNITF